MKVTHIIITSIDDTKTGNSIFKCRIDLQGLSGFNADLTYQHLRTYANNGVIIILKIMSGGLWVDHELNMEDNVPSNPNGLLDQNSYGNR